MKQEHTRTIDLIDKLSETSSGAVKTRERVLSQLRAQLEFQVRALQEHLVPLLQKHEDTASLAKDASKGEEPIRRALGELDQLPEEEREFSRKLRELKREVQQYFREEEKGVLAALKRAMDDSEVQELAKQLRDAKKEEPGEGEQPEGQLEEGLAYARAGVHELRSRLEQITGEAQAGQRQFADAVTGRSAQVAQAVVSAGRIYGEAAQDVAGKMQALLRVPTSASQSMREIGTIWTEWLRDTASANVRFAQELVGCRDFQSLAQMQRHFVQESSRQLLARNVQMLKASERIMAQALEPLEQQLEGGTEETRSRGGNR